jgi:hypothetical protein
MVAPPTGFTIHAPPPPPPRVGSQAGGGGWGGARQSGLSEKTKEVGVRVQQGLWPLWSLYIYTIHGTHFRRCVPALSIDLWSTLQRKSHICIPFLGIAWPQLQFNIHVSVSDLDSPRIGLHISSSGIGRPIVEIYKWLTDA